MSPDLLFSAGALVFGYVLGSLSAAIITCKLMGLPDPRTTGSNNPGTTNVLRSGGKKAAAITLLGDLLKGVIAVIVVGFVDGNPTAMALAGFGAFLGHLYPVFFRFQGGKGVATALGALLALSWISGLLAIATWLAMSLCFRISSLAALTTFALAPLYLWMRGVDVFTIGVFVLVAMLLAWRHRNNIKNLMAGTEPKIGEKKKT
ncbi:MAG: glycerol-3-phosphate 1-O-acyltransferase PlsY [Pseudomonadota bacterium]